MEPVINTFLKTASTEISTTRTISWETFLKANMISQVELENMLKFDKLSNAQWKNAAKVSFTVQKYQDFLLKDIECFKIIVLFLQKIVRVDTVQYLLVLLDHYLTAASPSILKTVPRYILLDAYSVLIRCLSKEDEISQLLAGKIISHLVLYAGQLPEAFFTAIVNWCKSQISTLKPSNQVDVALQTLSTLLRTNEYRESIYNYPNLVAGLLDFLLKGSSSPQTTYQIIFCFWLITFIPSAASGIQKKYDLISTLGNIAKSTGKEKVVRVCVLTLKSLLEKAPAENMMSMVGNKIYTLCETLSGRKWTDEDILEDLEYLKTQLYQCIQKLTNWDEYASEVRSGHLEWSPVHKSEAFWKQNAQKLNEKDHELLRILSRLLSTSTSPLVLAVACYDIMQYIKYYSFGKRFIQDLGAKQRIMELMAHSDADVRYNALMALQQFMSNVWDFQ